MEETISLEEIFKVIKKHIKLIILLVVVAAFVSASVTTLLMTKKYEATAQFVVNQDKNEADVQYNYNDIRTNVQLINTYNVIIKSPAILDKVVDELGLDTSSSSLEKKISVSSAENSQVVNVTVTDADPYMAAKIANTTVDTFQEDIPALLNVDNVQILTEAVVGEDPSPVSPNLVLNIVIAIVLGAMVGVGLAFLLEYLDKTIKTEEDIEKYLGIHVIGVISTISESDVRSSSTSGNKKSRKRKEV